MRRVLILGATSAIAEEAAKLFATRGDRLFLAARNSERLEAIAADLRVRGATHVGTRHADLADLATHGPLLDEAWRTLDGVDTVLLAYGTLSDQKRCEGDVAQAELELRTNFVSAASLLSLAANRMEEARRGTIAVISSVAGDRGRQSNYVYGSAKAALTAFTSGLRNRLFRSGVRVVTIKPGFVDTPMTAAFPKNRLFVGPDVVARGIHRAIERGTPVVYLPGKWRLIMWIIRNIPERIFMRLKL
jgi:decaprenylphospho-beta-D-erythro-pentofuranosid-2-ulose 2-reductase